MSKEKISTEDAIQQMFDFINHNLTGVEDVEQKGNDFLLKKDGIEISFRTTEIPFRPADKYIKESRENSKAGIANALLQVRSTSNYDGRLLKKVENNSDGEYSHYKNKKNITEFEQKVIKLYSAPIAYYNPLDNTIDLIKFIRTHRIPGHLQIKPGEDGSNQEKHIRQKRHIHESKREGIRKIAFEDRIKSQFTFEIYDKKNSGVLVARIVPYNA